MTRRECCLAFGLLAPLVAAAQQVSDDRIHDQVRIRLAKDRDVKGGALEVEVENGVVTLRGQVDSDKRRRKAGSLAKGVKGVTGVNNELTVATPRAAAKQ